MYNNIGETLKRIAEVFCWIGIIVSVVIGLASFAISSEITIGGLSIYSILIMILGPIAS